MNTLPKKKHSLLTERDADKIAKKLGAEIKSGRKHPQAIVRVDGMYVGRFGIRRGSGTGHDYIPEQIHTSMRKAIGLARCYVSREEYETDLGCRGVLPGKNARTAKRPLIN